MRLFIYQKRRSEFETIATPPHNPPCEYEYRYLVSTSVSTHLWLFTARERVHPYYY